MLSSFQTDLVSQKKAFEISADKIRKELTLLKKKHADRLSPRDTNERPGSAEPTPSQHVVTEYLDRPNTALAHLSPHTQPQTYHSSVEKNLALLRQKLQNSPVLSKTGMYESKGCSILGLTPHSVPVTYV